MLNRVYFHYEHLEEFQCGMWRIVRGEQRMINAIAAANHMRDSIAFKTSMMRAVHEWPNSCLQNLTAEGVNKIAWFGHAGNCLGVGSPEENTRIGWHMLNPGEQAEANRVAGEVLDYWERSQITQLELDLA
jgi:hypothetical protein